MTSSRSLADYIDEFWKADASMNTPLPHEAGRPPDRPLPSAATNCG